MKVMAVSEGSTGYSLYILEGHTLQKWSFVVGEVERFVNELDLNRLAVDYFQENTDVSVLYRSGKIRTTSECSIVLINSFVDRKSAVFDLLS